MSRSIRAQHLRIDPKALEKDDVLANNVRTLLMADERSLRGLVGETTITAYRRVHEVIASTLDRLAEASAGQTGLSVSKLLVDLSRCLVLVKYQLARGQLSRSLAEILANILTYIIDKAKTSPQELRDIAPRARTLLDALAVVVYQLGKKR